MVIMAPDQLGGDLSLETEAEAIVLCIPVVITTLIAAAMLKVAEFGQAMAKHPMNVKASFQNTIMTETLLRHVPDVQLIGIKNKTLP